MTTPNPQAGQEEAVRAAYGYAADLMKNGQSHGQVVRQLVEKGLDQKAAAIVANNAYQMNQEALQAAAYKNMLYGGLWCVGGIIVTVGSYVAAGNGGSYILAWGAIIFGAIQFFRGLLQLGQG